MKKLGKGLIFFSIIVVAALLSVLLLTDTPRPNIILITMDTTRIDHLSCYGYERKTSKNLDVVAEDGQIFKNAYANSSWTYPSHASLMTGMYPASHGAIYDINGTTGIFKYFVNRFSDSNTTLAETLLEEGYNTIGIVGGIWLKKRFGLHKGFEIYEDDIKSLNGLTAKEIHQQLQKHINKRTKQPFFLFINYFDPHNPYTAPDPFDNLYTSKSINDIVVTATEINRDRKKMSQNDLGILLGKYDGEIAYMDFYMGKLFSLLKEINMYDNSWIIITSDHGESFGDHDYAGHGGMLHDDLINVPLILKYPKGWSANENLDERIQLMDIMPTILSRLEIPIPATCQGQPIGNITHEITAEIYRNKPDIISDGERFNRDLIALYKGSYKLIWSSDGANELYDIVNDPLENDNIINQFRLRAEELTRQQDEWYKSIPKAKKSSIGDLDQRTVDQLKALGYLN